MFHWQVAAGRCHQAGNKACLRLYDKGSLSDPYGNGRLGVTIQEVSVVVTNMPDDSQTYDSMTLCDDDNAIERIHSLNSDDCLMRKSGT